MRLSFLVENEKIHGTTWRLIHPCSSILFRSVVCERAVIASERWLHRSWIIIIFLVPILLFSIIIVSKIMAGRKCRFRGWCGERLTVTGTFLFIYFIHFELMPVDNQINQRWYEKTIICIPEIMFTYCMCCNTKFPINKNVQWLYYQRIVTIHSQVAAWFHSSIWHISVQKTEKDKLVELHEANEWLLSPVRCMNLFWLHYS